MLLGSFSFVWNHSRNCRRKSGFSGYATRLFAHVDDFLFAAPHLAGEISATSRKKKGSWIGKRDPKTAVMFSR
jgi:hypothetical protein